MKLDVRQRRRSMVRQTVMSFVELIRFVAAATSESRSEYWVQGSPLPITSAAVS
jgi:hypothetical protein